MEALQREHVPAGIVRTSSELLEEPQLCARGFWQMRERAFIGLSPNPSAPYRTGSAPLDIDRPAPTLGQHNRDVLVGMLALSEAELADLESRGVIGTRPRR
jgi:crotonobetainyl-CoA:carnitine CoA-transferase CaiB-like acyl-CoA transferase